MNTSATAVASWRYCGASGARSASQMARSVASPSGVSSGTGPLARYSSSQAGSAMNVESNAQPSGSAASFATCSTPVTRNSSACASVCR